MSSTQNKSKSKRDLELFTVNSKNSIMKSQIDSRVVRRMI